MEFYLGKLILSYNLPDYQTFVLLYAAEFLIILFFMLMTAFITELAEKSATGLYKTQNCHKIINISDGLKIIANALKLIFKENIIPDKSEKLAFITAPLIIFVPILLVYSIIPFNTDFCVNKTESGLMVFVGMLLIYSFGVTLAGISSKNKFSILGAMRNCTQLISYTIPLLLTVLSISVLSGSVSLQQIIISQSKHDIFSWYIFPDFIGFVLFFIISFALINRNPFNFSTSESEITGGYKTEYSGINLALLNLSEFSLFFIVCVIIVTLFFGGFLSPFGIYVADWFTSGNFYYAVLTVEQLFWLFVKTILLMLLIIFVSKSITRFKPSNFASFCWKYLIPVSVINLIIVTVLKLVFGGFYV